MAVIRIGEVEISRVEEVGGPSFRPTDLFPDWHESFIEKHRSWLVPRGYHERTGRFMMGIQSWVVRTPTKVILVDTGIGNGKERPHRPSWNMLDLPWLERLKEAGFTPDAIDIVLCTHLHVDHVGWNTTREGGRPDGKWVPTFPNARYLFPKGDYDYWLAENAKAPAGDGCFDDSVAPIVEAGRAELVPDTYEIEPGVQLVPSPGHSPGHVCLLIESGGKRALISGDVMHHPLQVYEADWSTNFDAFPDQARETRKRLLDEYADTGTLVMPCHFPRPHCGYVRREGTGYRFDFAD